MPLAIITPSNFRETKCSYYLRYTDFLSFVGFSVKNLGYGVLKKVYPLYRDSTPVTTWCRKMWVR